MNILDWLKTIFTSPIVIVFTIAALGYLVGSVQIKGLSLGTSGILLVALVFGHYNLMAPDVLKNIGLICFVTAVGFIAGPTFFRNLKKSAIFYVILGIVVILSGTLTCIASMTLGKIDTDLAVGMMAGAMTSTPALGALISVSKTDSIALAYAATYPVGLIVKVLCCQFLPILFG